MNAYSDDPIDTMRVASTLRMHALRMVHAAQASHIGTCLSMADLLAVAYGSILSVDPTRPKWEGRDRFVLSKGHGAAILYACLAERGFFPLELLDDYSCDGSILLGHASHHVPGVEVSTGALGHGLPIAAGMALAAKTDAESHRVFVLLGDGELDEGSNWEAIMFAAAHRLDNLMAIVDCNELQALGMVREVLDIEPLDEKFLAFGWDVLAIDGHDHAAIAEALAGDWASRKRPAAVLARTVKGKGVSFMEGRLEWHYKAPSAGELAAALVELEAQG